MLVKYATQGQGDPFIQPPKNCLEKANYYKVYIVKMRKREDPHTAGATFSSFVIPIHS